MNGARREFERVCANVCDARAYRTDRIRKQGVGLEQRIRTDGCMNGRDSNAVTKYFLQSNPSDTNDNKVLLENGHRDSAAHMSDLNFRDYERRVTVHYEETESVEVTEFVNDDEEVVLRITRRRPLPEPSLLPLSSFMAAFFYGYCYLSLLTYLWKIKSWLRRS